MKRRKVLVVCMFDSVHSGRWLKQFSEEDIDFYVFPSKKYKFLNSIMSELVFSQTHAKFNFQDI